MQEEVTILRVHKNTRERLRKLAVAKRESYDEIINRLLTELLNEPSSEGDLEKTKQKLLKAGINKDLVNLVGIIPKTNIIEDKEKIRAAIRNWASKKR